MCISLFYLISALKVLYFEFWFTNKERDMVIYGKQQNQYSSSGLESSFFTVYHCFSCKNLLVTFFFFFFWHCTFLSPTLSSKWKLFLSMFQPARTLNLIIKYYLFILKYSWFTTMNYKNAILLLELALIENYVA